uniref:Carbonic anhydrase 4 n=1 Tax=Sinocyclocheilus grahami TaxID=75366 RepID=A0A672RFN5_SINGR
TVAYLCFFFLFIYAMRSGEQRTVTMVTLTGEGDFCSRAFIFWLLKRLTSLLKPTKIATYILIIDRLIPVSIPITATVSGGNLGETYKAVQFHLHWGTNGGPGSEHTVDGEQYPITLFNKISLNQLIPPEVNMTSYYRYDGSLTTPGCTEAVVWTVFENPIPLDREQLRAFSTLKFNDGNPMVGTFRPVQPRNRRVVYRSSGNQVLLHF